MQDQCTGTLSFYLEIEVQCSALPAKAAPILQAEQSKEAVTPAGAGLMVMSRMCATCSRSNSTHPSQQQPHMRLVAPGCTFLFTFSCLVQYSQCM